MTSVNRTLAVRSPADRAATSRRRQKTDVGAGWYRGVGNLAAGRFCRPPLRHRINHVVLFHRSCSRLRDLRKSLL